MLLTRSKLCQLKQTVTQFILKVFTSPMKGHMLQINHGKTDHIMNHIKYRGGVHRKRGVLPLYKGR